MDFAKLEKTDVTNRIEKKGQFSYLSWPYAVSEFRRQCPDGYWRVGRSEDGAPYFTSSAGHFVEVTIHTGPDCPGFTQIHPVLNHKNRPIEQPNAFDINTSIQRCLVKAISIATGIGLHIYAGEDLPPDENGRSPKNAKAQQTLTKKQPSAKPDQAFLSAMKSLAVSNRDAYSKALGSEGYESAKDVPEDKQSQVYKVVEKAVTT